MKGLLKKLCDFTFKSLTDESDTKSEEKSEDQTDQSDYVSQLASHYSQYESSNNKYSGKIIDEPYACYNVSLWDEEDYYLDLD